MKNDFVPTRSSAKIPDGSEQHESIHFFGRKKNDKRSGERGEHIKASTKRNCSLQQQQQTEMKKLRYEVIKLGTSGMNPDSKEKSKIALAVSLGAKAPKKKYVNYKDILATKKAQKSTDASSGIMMPLTRESKHMFVVGEKVFPARPKSRQEGMKNFLENYGKGGRNYREKRKTR